MSLFVFRHVVTHLLCVATSVVLLLSSAVSISVSCLAVESASFLRWRTLAAVISMLALFKMAACSFLRLLSAPRVAQVADALLPRGKTPSSRHSSLNVAWYRASS